MDQRRRRRHSSEEGGASGDMLVAILLPKCMFGCCHMVSSCFIMFHHVSSCFIMFHHVSSCFIMFHHVSCSINFNHVYSLDDDPYSWWLRWGQPTYMCQAPGRRERHVSISLSPHRFGHKGCLRAFAEKSSTSQHDQLIKTCCKIIQMISNDYKPILQITLEFEHSNKLSQQWG